MDERRDTIQGTEAAAQEGDAADAATERRDFLKAVGAVVAAGAAAVVPGSTDAQQVPAPEAATPAQRFVQSRDVRDLREVRLPGGKSFEELTIGELVQLRPGAELQDSYNIEAVSSDVSISTSSMLASIARLRGNEAIENLAETAKGLGASVPIEIRKIR